MIDPLEPLSISRQCELLAVSRSSHYYKPKSIGPEQLALMDLIDKLYTEDPSRGSRSIVKQLQRQHGIQANRKKIQRLMRLMQIEAGLSQAQHQPGPSGSQDVPISFAEPDD
jgi:putative transposase